MIAPARIERRELPEKGRVIAISDVHGSLRYLKGLLGKPVPDSGGQRWSFAATWSRRGRRAWRRCASSCACREERRCLFVLGNCDYWYDDEFPTKPCTGRYVRDYLLSDGNGLGPGLLAQMCAEIGFEAAAGLLHGRLREALGAAFAREFEFLASMPQLIETESYIFVHGGIPRDAARCDGWSFMKDDKLHEPGPEFGKWVIAGHWPVVLYRERVNRRAAGDRPREPYRQHRTAAACSRTTGSSTPLSYPITAAMTSLTTWYDPFPVRRVKSAQAAGENSAYIRWGDNEVEILERGEEFSRVRHVRTGYELDILTKYLYGGSGVVKCNDCTDYVLPLAPGDEVSVVEATSRGYLVKHEGVSGWYFGELE